MMESYEYRYHPIITDQATIDRVVAEAILQHKRAGYKKNYYGYRERNLEKAKAYAREYAQKTRLKQKLEKEANKVETLGK